MNYEEASSRFWQHESQKPLFPEPQPSFLPEITQTDLQPVYAKISSLSLDSLASRIAVRQVGASNDMLTSLYELNLTAWHRKHERFSDAGAFWHRVGLLYGAQLVADRYKRALHVPLNPTATDAYDCARATVLDSYEYIPDIELPDRHDTTKLLEALEMSNPLSPWEREKRREARYLGSNSLMVMNVLLADTSNVEDEVLAASATATPDAEAALYTGMLDAAIFGETYASAAHGVPVRIRQDVPADIRVTHGEGEYTLQERQPDGSLQQPQAFDISMMDGLDAAFNALHAASSDIAWRQVRIGTQDYPALLLPVLRQADLRHFEPRYSIIGIQRSPEQPYPWDQLKDPRTNPFSEPLRHIFRSSEARGFLQLNSPKYATTLASYLHRHAMWGYNTAMPLEASPPIDASALSKEQRQLLQLAVQRWAKA